MKRTVLTSVVVLSVFCLVTSASADQKNRNRDKDNSNNRGNFKKHVPNQGSNLQRKLNFGQNNRPWWKANGDVFGKSAGNVEHKQPKQLDPGRPDGRVQVPDVAPPTGTLPPSRPGYVFVNGHWERAKAGSVTTGNPAATSPPSRPGYVFVNGRWERAKPNQLDPGRPDGRVPVPDVAAPAATLPPSRPGYVFVNGHWERATAGSVTTGNPANASVEVRDHRVIEPTGPDGRNGGRGGQGGYRPLTPKDPSTSNPPPLGPNSSVQDTDPPGTVRPKRDTTIYGTGPGPVDVFWGFWKIHDPRLHWDSLPPWGFTAAPAAPANPRDHRGTDPAKQSK